MSGLEKFGLLGGIIGLIADAIGLTTFFLGLWQPSTSNATESSISPVLLTIMGITIFYGWVAIAWYLLRYGFVHRDKTNEKKSDGSFDGRAGAVTIGIGLLLSPLYLAWIIALGQSNVNLVEYELTAKAQATRTAKIILTPTQITGTDTPTPTPIVEQSVQEIVDNSRSRTITAFLVGGIIGSVVITFMVFIILLSLMPQIYYDMN